MGSVQCETKELLVTDCKHNVQRLHERTHRQQRPIGTSCLSSGILVKQRVEASRRIRALRGWPVKVSCVLRGQEGRYTCTIDGKRLQQRSHQTCTRRRNANEDRLLHHMVFDFVLGFCTNRPPCCVLAAAPLLQDRVSSAVTCSCTTAVATSLNISLTRIRVSCKKIAYVCQKCSW